MSHGPWLMGYDWKSNTERDVNSSARTFWGLLSWISSSWLAERGSLRTYLNLNFSSSSLSNKRLNSNYRESKCCRVHMLLRNRCVRSGLKYNVFLIIYIYNLIYTDFRLTVTVRAGSRLPKSSKMVIKAKMSKIAHETPPLNSKTNLLVL